MRVLHVISSLSAAYGGTSYAVRQMAQALHGQGVKVDIAITDDDGPGKRLANVPLGTSVSETGDKLFCFAKQTEIYHVCLPLARWFLRHVADYDLVHINGIFTFTVTAAGWAARLRNVPYIMAPHGMLNAYGMTHGKQGVKGWSLRLVERPLANHAKALHFTSEQEREDARRLHLVAPMKVIPLGIDLSPFTCLPNPEIFRNRFPETRGRQVALFLSRVDPKKGIELLLEAYARASNANQSSRLVIAGSGEPSYVQALQARAEGLGLKDRIVWTGHLEGEVKLAAFATADVFVLPSRSENFGLALLEAMACGRACIASDQVALAVEAGAAGAVRALPRTTEAWTDALESLLGESARRQELGIAAQQLARQRYSIEAMGRSLREMYEEILAPKATLSKAAA